MKSSNYHDVQYLASADHHLSQPLCYHMLHFQMILHFLHAQVFSTLAI